MESLKGLGVALVTPFKEDKSVDVPMLKKLVEHNISNGTDYLVVLGTTAEPHTLSKKEKELIKFTIKEVNANRLPMVLGVSNNSTQALVDELKSTDFSDYEAILSVAPYYNKPSQEGIYQHFVEVAEASPLPIILYNVPARTGSNIDPETALRLAKVNKKIVAIKEAADDMHQALRLLKILPKDFGVISGSDSLALQIILSGGSGVISVLGGVLTAKFSEMIKCGLNGESKKGHEIYYKLIDLIDYIFEEGNPGGIKSVMAHQLDEANLQVRLPLVKASKYLHNKIGKELKLILG